MESFRNFHQNNHLTSIKQYQQSSSQQHTPTINVEDVDQSKDNLDDFVRDNILSKPIQPYISSKQIQPYQLANDSNAGQTYEHSKVRQNYQINTVSPNLFHNPLTSGLNSTKNAASPMLNNTANFQAFANNLNQKHSQLQSSNKVNSSNDGALTFAQQHTFAMNSINNDIPSKTLNYQNQNDEEEQQNENLDPFNFKKRLQDLKANQQKISDQSSQITNQKNQMHQRYQSNTQILVQNESKYQTKSPNSPLSDTSSLTGFNGLNSNRKSHEKLYQDHKDKQKRIELMQNIKANQERHLLQNKPIISPKSQKLAQNRDFYQNQNEFLQKKQEYISLAQQQKLQQEQQMIREKPQINSKSQAINRNIQDLYTWNNRKDARMKEMKINHDVLEYEKQQQELQKAKHVSVGSQQYLKSREKENIPIENRLQEYGMQSQHKREAMKQRKVESERQQWISPKINKTSEKIIEQKMQDNGYQKYSNQRIGLPSNSNLIHRNNTELHIGNLKTQQHQSLSPSRNNNQIFQTQNYSSNQPTIKMPINQPQSCKNLRGLSKPSSSNFNYQNPQSQMKNYKTQLPKKQYASLYEKVQLNNSSSQQLDMYDQQLNQIHNKIQNMPTNEVNIGEYNSHHNTLQNNLDKKNERILDLILDTDQKMNMNNMQNTRNLSQFQKPSLVSSNLTDQNPLIGNSLQNTGTLSAQLMTYKSISSQNPNENMFNQTSQSGMSLLSSGLYQQPIQQRPEVQNMKNMQNNTKNYNSIQNRSNNTTSQLNFLSQNQNLRTNKFENNFFSNQSNSQSQANLINQKQFSSQQNTGRWKDLPVVERNEIWLNNKNKKIESAREEQKDKDVVGCTFEPKLFQYKPPKPNQRNQGSMLNDSRNEVNQNRSINKSYHNMSQGNIMRDGSREPNSYAKIYERKQSQRSLSYDNLHNHSSRQSLGNQSRTSSQIKFDQNDAILNFDQTPILPLKEDPRSKANNMIGNLNPANYYKIDNMLNFDSDIYQQLKNPANNFPFQNNQQTQSNYQTQPYEKQCSKLEKLQRNHSFTLCSTSPNKLQQIIQLKS
eukprot:403332765